MKLHKEQEELESKTNLKVIGLPLFDTVLQVRFNQYVYHLLYIHFSYFSVSKIGMRKLLSNFERTSKCLITSKEHWYRLIGNVLLVVCRYWWAKIRALSAIGDYEELERFSRQRKSPIGYEVRLT